MARPSFKLSFTRRIWTYARHSLSTSAQRATSQVCPLSWPQTTCVLIFRNSEHEFSAVLSPAIATKYEEGASRVMGMCNDPTSALRSTEFPPAIIPSVGDAIDALSYVHDGLSQTLKQFLDFSAELASKDHAMENIPEVNMPCSQRILWS